MPAIHVRGVDEEVIAALKSRAARHHRSLQGELLEILAGVAREESARRPLSLTTVHIGGASTSSRDEIYDDDGR